MQAREVTGLVATALLLSWPARADPRFLVEAGGATAGLNVVPRRAVVDASGGGARFLSFRAGPRFANGWALVVDLEMVVALTLTRGDAPGLVLVHVGALGPAMRYIAHGPIWLQLGVAAAWSLLECTSCRDTTALGLGGTAVLGVDFARFRDAAAWVQFLVAALWQVDLSDRRDYSVLFYGFGFGGSWHGP